MVIFHSYVKLPEGNPEDKSPTFSKFQDVRKIAGVPVSHSRKNWPILSAKVLR
jgi:hypothetical protein